MPFPLSIIIIYPGEFHDITKPSYLRDLLERYLNWYDNYLIPRGQR